MIAQHKDATLPDHYKPIYEYLQTIDTKQLLEFDFLEKLKTLFASDDLGFIIEALIQIVQFALDNGLQLCNIEQVELFMTEYLEANKLNCQQ